MWAPSALGRSCPGKPLYHRDSFLPEFPAEVVEVFWKGILGGKVRCVYVCSAAQWCLTVPPCGL